MSSRFLIAVVVLAMAAGPAPAGVVTVTCYPAHADYQTGSVTDAARTQTSLVHANGDGAGLDRGYMKFDISAIPDNAVITGVELHVYVYANHTPEWYITDISSDPATGTPAAVWADIDYSLGYYVYSDWGSSPAPGWRIYNLNVRARADLEAGLSRNWFACGFHAVDPNPANYIRFHGWNEANVPYVVVSYFTGTVGYAEDFDPDNGGFEETHNNLTGWQHGVPTSGPGAAHSGTKCWATNLSGQYASDADWRLHSPRFIAAQDNPWLTFFHWHRMELEFDGGNVKYSTDGGTHWDILPGNYDVAEMDPGNAGIPEEPGYSGNSGAWLREAIEVPVARGQSFEVRWHFGSDIADERPGWYLDDVTGYGFSLFPGWSEGWVEVESMPDTPTALPVKDGAWLATHFGPDSHPFIYAAKGNKTTDFYRYDAVRDTWAVLETIPTDEEGRAKPPRKGCRGVSNGTDAVYMTKGNNTLGFWKYAIGANSWAPLAGVPEGPDRRRVKGGEDLVYVRKDDTGWVYLLKGYRTEFYRYNTMAGRWDTLDNVPYGGDRGKYDRGSFLVYDGAHTIYAHQAKYYDKTNTIDPHHYMFRYDLAGDTWYSAGLRGVPLLGLEGGREGRKKKSGDGGAGAWQDNSIYALKGYNTQGFYRYFPGTDAWVQLDTVPGNGSTGRKKRVKYGGDLAAAGYGGLFALKGNKTYELWRYVEGTLQTSGFKPQARSGAQAGKSAVGSWQFAVVPNPIATGFATLRLSLSKAGPVSVNVFDVAGRSVLRTAYSAGRSASSVSLDLRKLSAGVYLVRLDAEGTTATQKLVVQRQ